MQGKDTDPKKDMLLVRRQWANGSLWATRKVWRTFTVVAKGPRPDLVKSICCIMHVVSNIMIEDQV